MINFNTIEKTDPDIYNLIIDEYNRQQNCLELIASENIPSESVLLGQASYHTLKYAEGYPGERYYGGCDIIDKTEQLAIDRACKLFSCKHANVQPHSGTHANTAVIQGLCKPGDKILSFTINSGGHLSHCSPASKISKNYEVKQIDVGKDGWIDYNILKDNIYDFQPNLVIIGFSAYTREINYSLIQEIINKYNETHTPFCFSMADIAHISGFCAHEFLQSPIPYFDVVTTTTQKLLRGPRGGLILWNKDELTSKINKAVFPGTSGGPLENIILSKAICFKEANSQEYLTYLCDVLNNAAALEDRFNELGVEMLTGGTDNHSIILDLTNTNLTGAELQHRLEEINIITNKNAIPFDPTPKTVTKGLRIGTPAVTSRGLTTEIMEEIAFIIWNVMQDDYDEKIKKIAEKIVHFITEMYRLP